MLQILKSYHVRQLPQHKGNAATANLQKHICPDLTYCAYNDAIKKATAHFGLTNARFTTHIAPIRVATAQFAEMKDISAIKLAGVKSQNLSYQYMHSDRVAIAALDIPSDSHLRIMKVSETFAQRMNMYISNHGLTIVASACTNVSTGSLAWLSNARYIYFL